MGIDVDLEFDQRTLRRISNLEERIRDIFTAQNNLASVNQVQQMVALISTELTALSIIVSSLERRVAILEDIPEIN
jgi:hypothetical protein